MTKEINVEEAAKWDMDTFLLNERYLRDRGRDAEADRARELFEKSTSDDVPPSGPADGSGEPEAVPTDKTVDEMLDWVAGDPDKAQKALDAENESNKPRVSLIEALEAILEP